MATFRVGQRVKLVRARVPENIGLQGVFHGYEFTPMGTICEDGPIPFDCDCAVIYDSDGVPTLENSARIEPILPSGAAPSEFRTLADLLQSLGQGVLA